jgi:hypothetical protein
LGQLGVLVAGGGDSIAWSAAHEIAELWPAALVEFGDLSVERGFDAFTR